MEMLEIPLLIITWSIAILLAPAAIISILAFFVFLFKKKE
jgi:hypothetical protein